MLCQTPLTLGGPGGGQQTLRRNPKEILDTRHPTCPSSPSLSPVFALGAQGTERNVSQAVTGLQGQDGGATAKGVGPQAGALGASAWPSPCRSALRRLWRYSHSHWAQAWGRCREGGYRGTGPGSPRP